MYAIDCFHWSGQTIDVVERLAEGVGRKEMREHELREKQLLSAV